MIQQFCRHFLLIKQWATTLDSFNGIDASREGIHRAEICLICLFNKVVASSKLTCSSSYMPSTTSIMIWWDITWLIASWIASSSHRLLLLFLPALRTAIWGNQIAWGSFIVSDTYIILHTSILLQDLLLSTSSRSICLSCVFVKVLLSSCDLLLIIEISSGCQPAVTPQVLYWAV